MVDLIFRKQKSNLWAAAFKIKVIPFSEESNYCAHFRQFNIYKKLIRDWRKNKKKKLENFPKSKKGFAT